MASDEIPPVEPSADKPPKARRKVPPRASVWQHFTRLDEDTSMCKYCGLKLGANSKSAGTSPMISHIKRCKLYLDSTDSDKKNIISNDGSVKAIKYQPEVFRQSVVQMVVINELPFSFVESAGFRMFCANILPLYKTFSRRTASREIVSLFMTQKALLKSMFSDTKKRVSLTTDIWVAPTTSCNYMVVTGHWIDDEWRMQKKILSFKPITDHKGDTIARHLLECLEEWGIEKVFSVTVDNARGNDRALNVFAERFRVKGADALVQGGTLMHMRCCAHVLNLIMKDGLSKASSSVVAIRNSVKYVRSSFSRLKAFELRCDGKVSRGSLTMDCETRWNSTYLMLTSAIKLRSAFERMVAEDKLFCEYFQEEDERGKKRVGPPTTADWEEVEVLVKFFKIFFNSTLVFSSSKSVTSTLCYHEIVTIEKNLISRCYNKSRAIRDQATSMRDKFDKYWDGLLNMNPLVIIASVFDPRNKMQFASLCFETLYVKDSIEFTQLQAVVSTTMKNLFNEYKSLLCGDSRSDDASSSRDVDVIGGTGLDQLPDEDDDEYERMDSIYAQILSERRHEASATELEIYLMEKTEIRSLNQLGMEYDVLSWWKRNSLKFPVLSELAKDVLAIQVTSVASESVFSTSGRILDPYRSSLTPFMVEALLCSQQWLRSSSADHVPNMMQMVEEVAYLESLDPRGQDD